MKKTVLRMALAGISIFAASSLLAQTAHKAVIDQAYPDMRGEVAMTLDREENAKVWSLADGKLLATFGKNSTDWNPKLLRYRLLHDDYVNSGISTSLLFGRGTNGATPRRYIVNGEELAIAPAAGSGFSMNRATGKIIEYKLDNNTTTIYSVTPPSATTTDKTAEQKVLVKYDRYSTPAFSPKGTWIYSPIPAQLIHPETGVITAVTKDLDLNFPGHLARYAFNPDETLVSIVTAKGMAVIETATGKLVSEVEVPAAIKQSVGYSIYPMADGKSFLYTGARYDWSSKGDTNRAWLVTEKGATELVD